MIARPLAMVCPPGAYFRQWLVVTGHYDRLMDWVFLYFHHHKNATARLPMM
jgi:hypothetical protein